MSSLLRSNLRGAEARLTADRNEITYRLERRPGRELVRELSERLAPHRHRRSGVSTLPGAVHYVTTTYFDTASGEVLRACLSDGPNIKLRAKEYYDLHPDLIELATDPRQLVRTGDILWLEVKKRDGSRTRKRRLGIPKTDVAGFLAHGTITPEMLALALEQDSRGMKGALGDLRALPGSFTSPLRASCLVNYRRRAWQDDDTGLRVTIDSEIGFFRPPPDLWDRREPLLRQTLGQPARSEDHWILEVKSRAELPAWLVELIERHGCEPCNYSKFIAAAKAVSKTG